MKTATSLLVETCVAWMLVLAIPGPVLAGTLTPVVVFPAFHFTILEVKVKHQSVFPECPTSGQFEDWFLNPNPSPEFSQVCRDPMSNYAHYYRVLARRTDDLQSPFEPVKACC